VGWIKTLAGPARLGQASEYEKYSERKLALKRERKKWIEPYQ